MKHLTTVSGTFHGRLVAARLGAEGVLVELRGLSDGPYPLPGLVDVWVPTDQLDVAREILLADAVDNVFDEAGTGGGTEGPPAPVQPGEAGEAGEAAGASAGPREPRAFTNRLLVLGAVAVAVMLLVVVIVTVRGSIY